MPVLLPKPAYLFRNSYDVSTLRGVADCATMSLESESFQWVGNSGFERFGPREESCTIFAARILITDGLRFRGREFRRLHCGSAPQRPGTSALSTALGSSRSTSIATWNFSRT